MHRRTLIVASSLAAIVTASSSANADDTITVTTTTVQRTLPPTFHGINYVGFWDPVQGSASVAKALANTPIRSVRFAGGDPGDWYDWQCPYYDGASCVTTPNGNSWSSTSPLELDNWAKPFGAVPFYQTCYQSNGLPNPPGQTYAANSAQNAGAWAAWTQQQGIDATFEVGNEEDINYFSNPASFTPYMAAFDAQATAIHAANPTAQVVGPASTNEAYWWGQDILGTFLESVGNKTGSGTVDGVSVHFYRGTNWSDSLNIAQYWVGANGPWAYLKGAIAAHDTRALPVYVTEWNLGDASAATNLSVGHALAIADLIGAYADSGVAGYHYFDIHGADGPCNSTSVCYGAFYGANENKPADTPTVNIYPLILWGVMGTGVLPVTQSVDPGAVVSAHATTRGDGSVQVMAINKTATAQSLSINLTGYVPQAGKGVAIYVLASAGDYTSSSATYNGQTDPDPTLALPAPTTQAVSGTTFSYSIAAYAMAVLDFGGTGIIPDAGADSSSGSSSSGSDSGGSGIDAGIDAGIGRDASLGTFADGGGANGAASDGSSSGSSGCGCTVVGSSDGAMPGLVALGGLAATFAFRRRRRETRISKASRGHEGREKT